MILLVSHFPFAPFDMIIVLLEEQRAFKLWHDIPPPPLLLFVYTFHAYISLTYPCLNCFYLCQFSLYIFFILGLLVIVEYQRPLQRARLIRYSKWKRGKRASGRDCLEFGETKEELNVRQERVRGRRRKGVCGTGKDIHGFCSSSFYSLLSVRRIFHTGEEEG